MERSILSQRPPGRQNPSEVAHSLIKTLQLIQTVPQPVMLLGRGFPSIHTARKILQSAGVLSQAEMGIPDQSQHLSPLVRGNPVQHGRPLIGHLPELFLNKPNLNNIRSNQPFVRRLVTEPQESREGRIVLLLGKQNVRIIIQSRSSVLRILITHIGKIPPGICHIIERKQGISHQEIIPVPFLSRNIARLQFLQPRLAQGILLTVKKIPSCPER